jgi:hypothetical protein
VVAGGRILGVAEPEFCLIGGLLLVSELQVDECNFLDLQSCYHDGSIGDTGIEDKLCSSKKKGIDMPSMTQRFGQFAEGDCSNLALDLQKREEHLLTVLGCPAQ